MGKMQQREPALKWVHADCARPGALGAACGYDVALDKGGLDALFEAGSDHMRAQGRAMVAEVHRVLRPGGRYLVFSNGGLGKGALEDFFSVVDLEIEEGYSCDLYQKFFCILSCVK